MNGLPYYKAYPRDFIEGTIGMPFEIKCAYRVVLDLIYMQGGNLPDDPRYISGLLGCSVRKWKSIRSALIECDKLQVSGKFLTNYRAVSELETLSKLQNKQSENRSRPNKNKDLKSPRSDHTEPEPYKKPPNPQNGGTDLFSAEEDPPPKPKPIDILSEVIPKGLAEDFIEHRKSLKKPLTDLAAKRIVSELRTFSNPAASIDASIRNGWAGVFAPKDSNGKAIRPASKDPTVLRALANAGGAR